MKIASGTPSRRARETRQLAVADRRRPSRRNSAVSQRVDTTMLHRRADTVVVEDADDPELSAPPEWRTKTPAKFARLRRLHSWKNIEKCKISSAILLIFRKFQHLFDKVTVFRAG